VALEASTDPIPKLAPLLGQLSSRQMQRLVLIPAMGGPPAFSVSSQGYLRVTGAGEDARPSPARSSAGRFRSPMRSGAFVTA
jgi:hypothetical protein